LIFLVKNIVLKGCSAVRVWHKWRGRETNLGQGQQSARKELKLLMIIIADVVADEQCIADHQENCGGDRDGT
jgi:hypothetical protein